MKTSIWNAFLPIRAISKGDDPPDADVTWLMSRGIEGEALSVLRHLRKDVLPIVRKLETNKSLLSYSFLVHDRTSGVPCPAEDHSAYIHLRLVLKNKLSAKRFLSNKWVYVSLVTTTEKERFVHEVLDRQAAWYLSLIERGEKLSDIDLLRDIRQFLHYFSNMSQMRIQ